MAEHSIKFYYNGNSFDGNGYKVSDELDKLKILIKQREEERKNSSLKLLCKT